MTITDYWRSRPYETPNSVLCSALPPWLLGRAQPLFRDLVVERLGQRFGRLERAVDVGCGPGDWTIALRRIAEESTGVDVNPAFLAEARRRAAAQGISGCTFVEADMAEFDGFAGASLVCLGGCIQYLDRQTLDRLLARIEAAQAPGQGLYVRTTVMNPLRRPRRTEHGIYRRRGFYDALFTERGYRVEETFYTSSAVPLGLAQRALGGHRPAARAAVAPLNAAVRSFRAVARPNDFLSWILVRT